MKHKTLGRIVVTVMLSALAGLAGCESNRQSITNTCQTSSLPPPEELSTATFLGLRDDESRKIGDSSPESVLRDTTNVSVVSVSDYPDYQRALASGHVTAHAKRNGYIYYAIKRGIHVAFPNDSSAWFVVTERYKAKMPGE